MYRWCAVKKESVHTVDGQSPATMLRLSYDQTQTQTHTCAKLCNSTTARCCTPKARCLLCNAKQYGSKTHSMPKLAEPSTHTLRAHTDTVWRQTCINNQRRRSASSQHARLVVLAAGSCDSQIVSQNGTCDPAKHTAQHPTAGHLHSRAQQRG